MAWVAASATPLSKRSRQHFRNRLRSLLAGANKGASGENAVIVTVRKVDVIIGSISILLADSMMGEMTAGMAAAVASSSALKLILPLTQEAVEVIGVSPEPLPHLVDHLVEKRLRPLVEKSLQSDNQTDLLNFHT